MKDFTSCEVCGLKFGIISWKRFCAKCNRTCCRDCLTGRLRDVGGNYSDLERVKICSDCVVAESTTQSISIHEDLELTGQINRDLRLELKEKILALEKFRTFLLQISTTFGPNSDLFPSSGSVENGLDDRTCDIGELITRCQDDFENMQDKVRAMRRRYEASISNEESSRSEIDRLNREIEIISSERDSLRSALSQVDALRHDMEDYKQHYSEVIRDYSDLLVRCRKLELLLRSSHSDHPDLSSVLNESNHQSPRTPNRRRFWLFASCCPRFFH
ncbi:uncharacterized protein TOT_020000049 [Theileria orientalis strain Shintoku]|uniref:FYVE-type domain-containing protein n=1 Tax=Theileria orientalis strain Shintoku TaxID=869250 RepID=J4C7X1_THEOR|nr:uncharacterized protein TOT_020000049 [Theileria orientalis strain Shintoku]PVC50528.1 hypothetical protein MACL_00002212 [Theileria orientalis]BAM39778.1 uncharacterized protein TOT_020000049 [Theileria orientalis strain Shintoku]|eukprot:XP_009690079.1 uncharacterized protein TOT_020000049 [Theileria orientalis strain Shintoku]